MQKGALEVEQDAAAVDAALVADTLETEPVVPVRSAKDAINAMYADASQNRLSNYLATSAKEIINASSKSASQTKSAANLHRGSLNHQMETVRPSASGIFKTARVQEVIVPSDTSSAMDPLARKSAPAAAPKRVVRTVGGAAPVVKTSLKLGPKKSPSKVSPQNIQQNRVRQSTTLRGRKGSTALAEMLAARRSATRSLSNPATTSAAQRPATAPSAKRATNTIDPVAAESIKIMQQAARKTTGQDIPARPPKTRTSRGMMMDVMRPARRPVDSIKRRFRAAPKDYIVQPETQDTSYTGYETDTQPPVRPPVEIYGMMDEEPKPTRRNPDGLGVVEDYHPQGGISEQKVAQGSGKAAPDNNKYALGGQSPFFLKSVNVEKRPLSDTPSKNSKKRKSADAGTLYEQPAKDPLGRKNVYNTPAEAKKPLPTKPTVIIPASRRSKAPLVILLLLTVILGAAVGGFVYLLFFKEIS